MVCKGTERCKKVANTKLALVNVIWWDILTKKEWVWKAVTGSFPFKLSEFLESCNILVYLWIENGCNIWREVRISPFLTFDECLCNECSHPFKFIMLLHSHVSINEEPFTVKLLKDCSTGCLNKIKNRELLGSWHRSSIRLCSGDLFLDFLFAFFVASVLDGVSLVLKELCHVVRFSTKLLK